jgi:hypothetical protein
LGSKWVELGSKLALFSVVNADLFNESGDKLGSFGNIVVFLGAGRGVEVAWR